MSSPLSLVHIRAGAQRRSGSFCRNVERDFRFSTLLRGAVLIYSCRNVFRLVSKEGGGRGKRASQHRRDHLCFGRLSWKQPVCYSALDGGVWEGGDH